MKVKYLLPVIALSLGTIGVADAADEKWYAGVKGGLMLIDNLDVGAGTTVDADNGLNGGLFVGYQWGLGGAGSIAVEGEFSTALSAGDMTITGPGGSITGEWEVQTLAIYAAYRSAGDLYFKGKIGFLDEDVDLTLGGTTTNASDTGMSLGLGAGWNIGTGGIEAEYTIIEEDVSFFSIAYHHYF